MSDDANAGDVVEVDAADAPYPPHQVWAAASVLAGYEQIDLDRAEDEIRASFYGTAEDALIAARAAAPVLQEETGTRELDIRFELRRIGLIAERTVERASEDDDLGAPDSLAVLGEIQRLAFEVAASLPSGDGDTEEVGVDRFVDDRESSSGSPESIVGQAFVDAGLLGAPAPPSGETGGAHEVRGSVNRLVTALRRQHEDDGRADTFMLPPEIDAVYAALDRLAAAPPAGETGDGRESREWSVLYKRAAGLHGDWRPAPAGASGEDEENGWELVRVREIPSEGARA